MAEKSTTSILTKWKRKKWVPIKAPKLFNEVEIGDTLTEDPSLIIGKKISMSLGELTNELRRHGISLTFSINSFENGEAKTEIVSYRIMPSFLKRFVKKRRDKIDLSFICETKDKVKVRIKPLFITKNNTVNSKQTLLRNKAKALIEANIKKTTYENFFRDILSNKLQRDIKKELNKIYPLKSSDIRVFERL